MKQTIYEEIQRISLLSNYDNLKTLSEQVEQVWLKYPCVINHPKAVKGTDSSGGINYTINGVVYYGNGRKMVNGTMAGFTCNDPEFKTTESDAWSKFPCVVNHPKATKTTGTDGGIIYTINGAYYYGNGRKMVNGAMSNFTCNDAEFTGITSGTTKTVTTPTELKDANGIKLFQDWLDTNAKGWATGYTDGIINKGQNGGGYGTFGKRTQKAWSTYKDQYLKSGTTTAATTTPAAATPAAPGPDDDVTNP